MAQTFRIAVSSRIGILLTIGEKSKISEDLFWNLVEQKVREITDKEPNKYEEALNTVKQHLLKGKSKSSKNSITVLNTWFEVQGIKN